MQGACVDSKCDKSATSGVGVCVLGTHADGQCDLNEMVIWPRLTQTCVASTPAVQGCRDVPGATNECELSSARSAACVLGTHAGGEPPNNTQPPHCVWSSTACVPGTHAEGTASPLLETVEVRLL